MATLTLAPQQRAMAEKRIKVPVLVPRPAPQHQIKAVPGQKPVAKHQIEPVSVPVAPVKPRIPDQAPDPNSKKRIKIRRARQLLGLLCEVAPTVFANERVALADTVRDEVGELVKGDFTAGEVAAALAMWCCGPKYLGALRAGASRYRLDGTCGDDVTQEQAEQALVRVAAWRAAHQKGGR